MHTRCWVCEQQNTRAQIVYTERAFVMRSTSTIAEGIHTNSIFIFAYYTAIHLICSYLHRQHFEHWIFRFDIFRIDFYCCNFFLYVFLVLFSRWLALDGFASDGRHMLCFFFFSFCISITSTGCHLLSGIFTEFTQSIFIGDQRSNSNSDTTKINSYKWFDDGDHIESFHRWNKRTQTFLLGGVHALVGECPQAPYVRISQ